MERPAEQWYRSIIRVLVIIGHEGRDGAPIFSFYRHPYLLLARPLLNSWQSLICCLKCVILLSQERYIHRVILYATCGIGFCTPRRSLDRDPGCSVYQQSPPHITTGSKQSVIWSATVFNDSPVEGHVVSFRLMAITNKPAVNIRVQVSV